MVAMPPAPARRQEGDSRGDIGRVMPGVDEQNGDDQQDVVA
jgi:hypothetical protein